MADQQDPGPHTGGASFRSRASSVISTNTKFSISTLPQESIYIDGVLSGQSGQLDSIVNSHAGRLAATRPASIYSFRSLPPYDENYSIGTEDVNESAISARSTGPHVQFAAAQDVSEAADETPPSPADPDNILSMHYGRIVRTIDENHARQVARMSEAYEQKLFATRHDIDQAYRQEFKARNKEVERIREEAGSSIAALESEVGRIREEAGSSIAALEAEIEALKITHDDAVARAHREVEQTIAKFERENAAAIEKARHAVEDTWESRWHDRNKLDAAETIRRDLETQGKLERAIAERDEKLIALMKVKHPESLDDLHSFLCTLKPSTAK